MPTKILVVDDEADLEFLITGKFRQKIRAQELEFLFARNGIEALDCLEANSDVAVVLSDINMPRMDGLTLLAALNERYPLLRTIIITAYGDMPNIRTAMNRGAHDFLTKPIVFLDLETTLYTTIQDVQQLRHDVAERNRAAEELKKHRDQLEELVKERTTELTKTNAQLQFEILERTQIEQALRESEEKYRTLFENLQDVFYRTDVQGNILLASPSIAKLLGYSEHHVLGMNLAHDIFAYPNQWEEFMEMMKQTGFINGFQVLLKQRDGSIEWASASARFYTDPDGQVVGVEGTIRDIRAQKQAESLLLIAYKELEEKNLRLIKLNASKDKFFSIISHDLRNPLSTILGFSELLVANLEKYSPQDVKDRVEKIQQMAEGLYALLENLLTWASVQRGAMAYTPEEIPLDDIVQETLELFASKADQKQIALNIAIPDATMIYADPNMLHTILRNLLSNAVKFSSAGGRITIAAQPYREEWVELAVSDTGIGIAEEDVEKLFRIDMQYTNTGTSGETGTGLGLTLCKELVEKNGGRIGVASEPGKGATFRLTLPRRRKK